MNASYLKKLIESIIFQKLTYVLLAFSWLSEISMIYLINSGGDFKIRNIYAFYYQIVIFLIFLVNSTVLLGGTDQLVWKIIKSNFVSLKLLFISRGLIVFIFNILIGGLMYIPIIVASMFLENGELFNLSLSEIINGISTYGVIGLFYAMIISFAIPFTKKISNIYLLSVAIFFFIPFISMDYINSFYVNELMFISGNFLQLILIIIITLIGGFFSFNLWKKKEYA